MLQPSKEAGATTGQRPVQYAVLEARGRIDVPAFPNSIRLSDYLVLDTVARARHVVGPQLAAAVLDRGEVIGPSRRTCLDTFSLVSSVTAATYQEKTSPGFTMDILPILSLMRTQPCGSPGPLSNTLPNVFDDWHGQLLVVEQCAALLWKLELAPSQAYSCEFPVETVIYRRTRRG